MTTITRERLLTIQSWRETYGPGSNVVLPAEEAEELARAVLASLDAAPVAWRYRYVKKGVTDSQGEPWVGDWKYMPTKEDCNELPSYEIQALYATQPTPAPVIPSVAELEAVLEWILKLPVPTHAATQNAKRVQNVLNACRAATLQVGNSPVSPDGWIPVSERIPDNTEFVLCLEKRAGYGTYGQPFVCWHDGDGWVGKTNYRPLVTHWMPLPAAPLQEVANGK